MLSSPSNSENKELEMLFKSTWTSLLNNVKCSSLKVVSTPEKNNQIKYLLGVVRRIHNHEKKQKPMSTMHLRVQSTIRAGISSRSLSGSLSDDFSIHKSVSIILDTISMLKMQPNSKDVVYSLIGSIGQEYSELDKYSKT